jgi:hypothetical protein
MPKAVIVVSHFLFNANVNMIALKLLYFLSTIHSFGVGILLCILWIPVSVCALLFAAKAGPVLQDFDVSAVDSFT